MNTQPPASSEIRASLLWCGECEDELPPGCNRYTEVMRIEWRYLDAAPESDRTGEKDLPRRGRPAGGMQWPS